MRLSDVISRSIPEVLMVSVFLCLSLMVSLPLAAARLDFECVFGDIVSSTKVDGSPISFCPTEMDPPFMNKGDFIWAFHKGRCFECVCEEGLGLACCECPTRRG